MRLMSSGVLLKKQKNVEQKYTRNYQSGDAYSYLDIKRETGLFVAFVVGKWIQETCDELYEQIAERTQQPTSKNKISFCTDANKQNKNAICKEFHKDSVNYGQVIKDKKEQIIYGVHKRKVLGNMNFNEISIAHVDGFCKALRERGKCFVREASTYPKKRKMIFIILSIFQAYHNFIDTRKGLTPCMKEGISDHIWTWGKLLNAKVSVEK